VVGTRWMDEALCRAYPTVMFETQDRPGPVPVEERAMRRDAVAVCGRCPVSAQCLDYAMRMERGTKGDYRFGIYAGLTGPQRAKIARSGYGAA